MVWRNKLEAKFTNKTIEVKTAMKVVSLYSGCGGLDLGVENAGPFKVIWANDCLTYACKTFQANFKDTKVICGKIEGIDNFPKADLIIGGFPCQDFSLGGNWKKLTERGLQYLQFSRCLELVKPKFFIAENVKDLIHYYFNGDKFLPIIIKEFESKGYRVKYKLLSSEKYGVPQVRKRIFIVGIRNDIDFEYQFPEETHGSKIKRYITLRDTIAGMPKFPEGDYIPNETGYSSRYMSRNRKRGWDEMSFTIQASGRQAPQHPMGEPMKKVGPDKWVFQGKENRRLSYKECALIQTFPENFIFEGTLANKYLQIGNAVPPLFAKKVAEGLVKK